MSDNHDAAALNLYLLRQELDLIQHPPLKVVEALAARCRQVGILGEPAPRIVIFSFLDLLPGKTFPLAKVDLTQCTAHTAVDVERLGNCHSCCKGPSQVTGINRAEALRAKSIDEFSKLNTAARVQFRIGVTAKGASHIRLRMANEKNLTHMVHTPQK